jgi:hypothetical protein
MENTVVCGLPLTHITAPLNMKLIGQALLELWSGTQKSRWPPGCHIGSRIATNIDRTPTLTPLKYEVD